MGFCTLLPVPTETFVAHSPRLRLQQRKLSLLQISKGARRRTSTAVALLTSHRNSQSTRFSSHGASVRARVAEMEPMVSSSLSQMNSPNGSPCAKISRGGNILSDVKDIIILQGFNWESPKSRRGWYNVVKEHAADIASIGITDVWLPPPSKSVDQNGYLPSQLYNLDASHFGNEQTLKELLDALHERGVRGIADIVINHRCGDFQDPEGNWTIFEGGTPDDRLDWGAWAIAAGDLPYGGQGQPDTGADYPSAPDIDHTNPRVQDELTKWMLWLKEDIGFDGWRFDFVKGYAGRFTAQYCLNTSPVFAVGELWGEMRYEKGGGLAYDQDPHRQQLVDWVDQTEGRSAAFDFTTKGILQEAVRNTEFWRLRDHAGRPSGMIGYWPAKAVTFIDNHDTGSSQKHWPFPSDKIMEGYAYILTHPGIPCILWDHVFDWGLKEKIASLIDVRKRNGINADSPIQILCADADLYVAKIGNRVVLKLGPRYDMGKYLPNADEWKIAAYGDGYAVWERK